MAHLHRDTLPCSRRMRPGPVHATVHHGNHDHVAVQLGISRADNYTRQQDPASLDECTTRLPDHVKLEECSTRQQLQGISHASRRGVLLGSAALALSVGQQGPVRAALVEEDTAIKVYEQCIGSVVSVITFKTNKAGVQTQQGVGSGFVWAGDDKVATYVVTNYHVISRLDKATDMIQVAVRPLGSSAPVTYTAQLVATDTMNDLAVLRLDDELEDGTQVALFPPAAVGTSADLKIGQSVFAIGAPWGLSSTLSAGVVSGLNRSIPSPVGTRIYGVIQTDASVNAGNSGGPLLDSSGRVVGVNTATFTRTGSGRGSGVNFALPIDAVRDIVPKLIVYGNARGKRV